MTGLLLCELHAHTTWSDGSQTIGQIVDTYGHARFDVLCITDHVVRPDDPVCGPSDGPLHVHAGNYAEYLAAIEIEAARARVQYDMLVLPGLELTYNDLDPRVGAHAVAVGLERFVGVGDGIERALRDARGHGAALIAAHPYPLQSRGGGAAHDGALRDRLARSRAARRPLGAHQPARRLRVGRPRRAPRGRDRRRPRARPRAHLEDAAPVPQGPRQRRRPPALAGARVPLRQRVRDDDARRRGGHRRAGRELRRLAQVDERRPRWPARSFTSSFRPRMPIGRSASGAGCSGGSSPNRACPTWTTAWRAPASSRAWRSMRRATRDGHARYYYATDDIDASCAKVRELGGTAESKTPVPTHGWFAACTDSEGNRFSPLAGRSRSGLRRSAERVALALEMAPLGGVAGQPDRGGVGVRGLAARPSRASRSARVAW